MHKAAACAVSRVLDVPYWNSGIPVVQCSFGHFGAHTRAVQFRGNPREDGQAWSEKKGKEDKLEAMQRGRKSGEDFSTQPHSENTAARSDPT